VRLRALCRIVQCSVTKHRPAGVLTAHVEVSAVGLGGPVTITATLNNTSALRRSTVARGPPPPVIAEAARRWLDGGWRTGSPARGRRAGRRRTAGSGAVAPMEHSAWRYHGSKRVPLFAQPQTLAGPRQRVVVTGDGP